MKLRILSDLHLEEEPYRYVDAGEDLVILAGDIADGSPRAAKNQEALFATITKPAIYVLGNHEFHQRYGCIDDTVSSIRSGLPSNVTLLHRESVEHDGVLFLGCPLWTDFRLNDGDQHQGQSLGRERAMQAAAMTIPDFSYLTDGCGDSIGPYGMTALHEVDRVWLDNRIKQAAGNGAGVSARPVVVITHWLPTPESVAPQYVGNHLTPYFASDCRDLMRDPVRLWIHGHTHVPCVYKHPGGDVMVVCNPRGTGPLGSAIENGFQPGLVMEVSGNVAARTRGTPHQRPAAIID